MKTLSYHQRLVKFGLDSLEIRRLRADLLFTYKLVFRIIGLKRNIPNFHRNDKCTIFSECELTFAICYRPSLQSVVCHPSVVCRSVTFVHPTQAIEIFGNVSTLFGTLAIC